MKRIFHGSGGRKAALILSLCLILALAAGATVAYLHAQTDRVTNTFKMAEPGSKIVEDFDGAQKRSIQVQNTGTATSYVRVKLVMNWVDEKNGNVSAAPVNITPSITSDWFEQNGIYYCRQAVAPKARSAELLAHAITQGTAPEGCHLEVTVLAESIQAAPGDAVQTSWGVRVNADGSLSPADAS